MLNRANNIIRATSNNQHEEDKSCHLETLESPLIGAAVAITGAASIPAQAEELFIPNFSYRSGPFAPNGIPFANGARDFLDMINKRDGGLQGVKIIYEECETGYDTKLIVECYERLKNKHGGVRYVHPNSTGGTYQLIPKATVDKVVIHSIGYGRTAAADGRCLPLGIQFPNNVLEPSLCVHQICWIARRWNGESEGQEDCSGLSQQRIR